MVEQYAFFTSINFISTVKKNVFDFVTSDFEIVCGKFANTSQNDFKVSMTSDCLSVNCRLPVL